MSYFLNDPFKVIKQRLTKYFVSFNCHQELIKQRCISEPQTPEDVTVVEVNKQALEKVIVKTKKKEFQIQTKNFMDKH